MIIMTRCTCGVAFMNRSYWVQHVSTYKEEDWPKHGEILFPGEPPTVVKQPEHFPIRCPAGCTGPAHDSPDIKKTIKGLWTKPKETVIKLEKV